MDAVKIPPSIHYICDNCEHSTIYGGHPLEYSSYKTIICNHPTALIHSKTCRHFRPKRERRFEITMEQKPIPEPYQKYKKKR